MDFYFNKHLKCLICLLIQSTETDDYVTMLYNDEVHSYEDVTGTLRKVLGIDDKKALEYAAIVDKEGRSTIKRGKKADCQAIKEKVEVSGTILDRFFISN